MDHDTLVIEFAKLKARVEPMVKEWEQFKARQGDLMVVSDQPAFESGVTDDNRDEIFKPLTAAPAAEPQETEDEAIARRASEEAQRKSDEEAAEAERAREAEEAERAEREEAERAAAEKAAEEEAERQRLAAEEQAAVEAQRSADAEKKAAEAEAAQG